MSTFENVPERLTKHVQNILTAGIIDPTNEGQVHFVTASCVIAEYLGIVFIPEEGENAPLTHRHMNMITVIGETLFLLRSSPAFPEFCRRMKGGNAGDVDHIRGNKSKIIRAAFQEMMAAWMFFDAHIDA
jgi:hypothetical protein